MKSSALAGLFIAAAMLASPVFADGDADLCKMNINKINSEKAVLVTDTSGASGRVEDALAQAKAAHDRGDDKQCVAHTNTALQIMQNRSKGGQ